MPFPTVLDNAHDADESPIIQASPATAVASRSSSILPPTGSEASSGGSAKLPAPASTPGGESLPVPDTSRQYLDVSTKSTTSSSPFYRAAARRPSIDSTYSELSELSIFSDELLQRSRPLIATNRSRSRSGSVRLGASSSVSPAPSGARRRGGWRGTGAASSVSPAPSVAARQRAGWRGTVDALWIRNKGVVLVLLAQAFGSLMNVATRILETNGAHGKAMHPLQILFVRQSLTSFVSLAYGYYVHIPQYPFGPRDLLPLLLARGLFGFFGVSCLYFTFLYMPLAEATVLTFLAPILTCYVCALLIPGESFSRQQQFAAVLSLVGVVVIARPASLFSSSSEYPVQPTPPAEMAPHSNSTSSTPMAPAPFSDPARPTAHQHLVAVLVSMVGVVGQCGALTAIRWIGTRTHPLISVNYFSVLCTIVSLVATILIPGVDFRFPANLLEWSLLACLGVCGYTMQFLLTAGLAYGGPSNESSTTTNSNSSSSSRRSRGTDEERPRGKGEEERQSSGSRMKRGSGTRATNMIYTQMLFALGFDKLIWGITPGVASWAGSGLILGSAIWVAVTMDTGKSSGSVVVVDGGDDAGARGAQVARVKERPRDGGTAEEEQGLIDADGRVEEGEGSREAYELDEILVASPQMEAREANDSPADKIRDEPMAI